MNTGVVYRLIFKIGIQPRGYFVKSYFINISGLLSALIRAMFSAKQRTRGGTVFYTVV